MKFRQKHFKLLPPSQREGDREAVVGVSKVGHNNAFECNCEGTSSQEAIGLSPVTYLRHTFSQLR